MAKVLVSIEDKLLARIDRAVKARGTTRSAFIQEMAERTLSRSGPGRDPKVRRAIERAREIASRFPYADDSTTLIRAERDSH